MGAAAAIVGGAALGWELTDRRWPADGSPLAPRVVAVLIGLNALSFVAALPVSFPSDVRRPEPPAQAVAGFFRDARRIAREPDAAGYLLGMASLQALVTAGSGAMVALALAGSGEGALSALVQVGIGAALGCAVASLEGHPHRCLGLVPYGATGLVLALGWAMSAGGTDVVPLIPCFLLGFMSGLINVPLLAAYLAAVPTDARGNGMAVKNAAIYVMTILLAGTISALVVVGALTTPLAQLIVLAVLTMIGAALGWRLLLMPALEVVVELMMLPMYRIRAHGPGTSVIPQRGPLLLIANHASYFDPLWLGKVVPRRLTPMMTSVFYDKPILRWLMRYAGVIRVQVGKFRREAPELDEAIAALRRGQCVLVFPEAILRRKEEQALRPFGQGAWHILREVPDVPVVVCWIEGGWGSYVSYKDGPPMKNKRLDRGRPIDIAFTEPAPLPADVLADQRATRTYLMKTCLECRRYLGLDVPPLPGAETDESDP
jgi:1-acyl-sn-glycerol-3-phosphate acyltransferase